MSQIDPLILAIVFILGVAAVIIIVAAVFGGISHLVNNSMSFRMAWCGMFLAVAWAIGLAIALAVAVGAVLLIVAGRRGGPPGTVLCLIGIGLIVVDIAVIIGGVFLSMAYWEEDVKR